MNNIINLEDFRKRVKNEDENNEQEEIFGLSEEEIEKLERATGEGDQKGTTEEERLGVITWAQDVRFKHTLLELILDGELTISWDEEHKDWKMMPVED